MERTPHYNVVVSERSLRMLTRHIRFLAEESPSAARKVKNALMAAINSLQEMPERFPFLDAPFIPPNKYHKMFVEKWYLILYQVRDQTVYVDYIIDGRQDYEWLIRSD